MQSEHRTFLTAGGPLRSPLSADASTHLQETVISTLVAGMLPVIGSKSYTDDVSSSLSITSPSIMSIARARGGSGVIREAHSLAPAVRSESPVTPDNRSETRRPPVRPGEAATSQMLKLKRMERRVPSEGTPRGKKEKGKGRTWLTLRSVNTYFFSWFLRLLLRFHRPAGRHMERWTALCFCLHRVRTAERVKRNDYIHLNPPILLPHGITIKCWQPCTLALLLSPCNILCSLLFSVHSSVSHSRWLIDVISYFWTFSKAWHQKATCPEGCLWDWMQIGSSPAGRDNPCLDGWRAKLEHNI